MTWVEARIEYGDDDSPAQSRTKVKLDTADGAQGAWLLRLVAGWIAPEPAGPRPAVDADRYEQRIARSRTEAQYLAGERGAQLAEVRAEVERLREQLIAADRERAELEGVAEGRHAAMVEAHAQVEALRLDNDRLRGRIHEAVNEAQARGAAVMAERDKLRNVLAEAEAMEKHGNTYLSTIGRALVAKAVLERDEARAEVERLRAEVDARAAEPDDLRRQLAGARAVSDSLRRELASLRADLQRAGGTDGETGPETGLSATESAEQASGGTPDHPAAPDVVLRVVEAARKWRIEGQTNIERITANDDLRDAVDALSGMRLVRRPMFELFAELERKGWVRGVRWAAAEVDGQAISIGAITDVIDYTDHLRLCASNPDRPTAIPRTEAPAIKE